MKPRKRIERKTPLRRSSSKAKTKTRRRTKGKQTVSKVKERIQVLLRQLAIERDGECVIGKYRDLLPVEYYECGPRRRSDEEIIVQAEHLMTRANAESFADMDNIILLCQRHHFFFKKQHSRLYWKIVHEHIGDKRKEKLDRWMADRFKPHPTSLGDWCRIEEELRKLPTEVSKGKKAD